MRDWLVKFAILLRMVRAINRSGAFDFVTIWLFTPVQAERDRRRALGNRFRLSIRLEQMARSQPLDSVHG